MRGLQDVPEDEEALRHVMRANLGQWLPHVNPLRAILAHLPVPHHSRRQATDKMS